MKKYQGFGGEELRRQLDAIVTVVEPSHSEIQGRGKKSVGEKPYQDHRSRQDTKTLIKNCLKEAKKPMTVIGISRYLGRSASPHFRSIITEMVNAGDLVESADTAPNGRIRYLYSLP